MNVGKIVVGLAFLVLWMAVVVASVAITLVGVCRTALNGYRKLSNRRRNRLLLRRSDFYYMHPASESSSQSTTKYASELAEEIDQQLHRGESFRHQFEGYVMEDGLPTRDRLGSLAVLHLQGGWPGMFPKAPAVNLRMGAHANHVR